MSITEIVSNTNNELASISSQPSLIQRAVERALYTMGRLGNSRVGRTLSALGIIGTLGTGLGIASNDFRPTTAFADTGNPAPSAGGETTENKAEPAGFKTPDGYVWEDGKEVVVMAPLTPADFDRVSNTPLKDIQTGRPRQAKAEHTEIRDYLDLAGADRLVFVNDPGLAERWGKDISVGAVTVGNVNPRNNPNAVFAYSETMIKPTEDPDHPNDIQVRFFLNPNCILPPVEDTADGNKVMPDVFTSFYSARTAHLAQVAFMFRDSAPGTKFKSAGFESDTPVSNLSYNMGKSPFFELPA